ADVYMQSRDLRPLDRYFPELHQALFARLPKGCVIDGEIVIAGANGLDFDALQMRLHPAESRVAKLARETPSSFVAFDALAAGGRDLRAAPQQERRERLEKLLAGAEPPVHLTPATRERRRLARALRGRGAGRRRREAVQARVPARQARDDQGEARAHRGLRRRRVPL